MNPYREAAIIPNESKNRPRSKLKTLYYKILIWYKGKWKERYSRCQYCRIYFWKNSDGINGDEFCHYIKCKDAKEDMARKHREIIDKAILQIDYNDEWGSM